MKVNSEIRKQIGKWLEENEQDMLNDLSKLIAVNSVRTEEKNGKPYGEESYQVLMVAKDMLEKRGFPVENFENMVITSDYGPDPPILGILAHLDIVDAGDGWDTDPFKMELKDGKLYGRGVIDNKGPAVASMYAVYCVSELFPKLISGVRLIFGAGEETGCNDVKAYLKKNAPPPNVFSPDATFPVVNVEKGRFFQVFSASWAESTELPRVLSIKGGTTPNIVPNKSEALIEGFDLSKVTEFCSEYSKLTGTKLIASQEGESIKITSSGVAAHAAVPQNGVNAQTALIKMLADMPFAESKGQSFIRALSKLVPHGDCRGEALGMKYSDDVSGDLTLNFGVVEFTRTGVKGNFDSRTPHCADDINLEAMAKEKFVNEGFSIDLSDRVYSHVTPEDMPFVKTLLKVYEEATGEKGFCESMGGGTYVHGIPGGVAFGCSMPGASHNVHGPNEFFEKDQLIRCAGMFAEVILEMCAE